MADRGFVEDLSMTIGISVTAVDNTRPRMLGFFVLRPWLVQRLAGCHTLWKKFPVASCVGTHQVPLCTNPSVPDLLGV